MVRTLWAFLRRDLAIAAGYRFSWSLQIAEVILTVAAYFFLGRLVDEGSAQQLAPYPDYFSFVIVGIAAFNYFFISLNYFTQRLRESQLNGTLEALLVTGTSPLAIFFYSYLSILLGQTVRWVAYLVVAAVAFKFPLGKADWGMTLLIFLLGTGIFLGLGSVSAAFILVFKKGDPLNWLLATLTWLISGTIFPVEVFPDWMQFASRLFPLTPIISGFRKAMLLGAGAGELRSELFTLVIFVVVLSFVGSGLLRWAYRRAQREGSLGHY